MNAVAKIPPEREAGLHVAVAEMLAACIGPAGRANAHGTIWMSVEQSEPRAGARIERAKRGSIPGFPDVVIIDQGQFFGLELKRLKLGRTSSDQRALHAELIKAGCRIAIARSCEQVVAALIDWEIPFRKIAFQGKAA